MNGGRVVAVVGMNNATDVRQGMPLIASRRAIDPDQLRNETVDLRSLHASPSGDE